VVVSASVCAAFLFGLLLTPLFSGRVFSMGDLSDFHLPLRHLYRSALVEGQSILWTDTLFGGFYIHAEGQLGALHPLHLVLYRLLPLTIAFNLELVASYVFCFVGMILLLRRLGMSTAAGLIGAIAFTFSGFNLLHLLHVNAVAVVAHVPWLLLTLEGVLSAGGRRQQLSIIGLSAFIGSILLLGYPQYVWIVALICAIYVAVNARRMSVSGLAIAGATVVTGVMLGGIQLLPTMDLLRESERAAMASDFALTYSLHPVNLAQLFSPYLLSTWVYAAPEELYIHEFGLYNGAYCTIAGLWVLVRWRHLPLRHLVVFACALVLVGLTLALGRYGVVYDALAALPLLGTFRAPTRHITLVHLGLALLAAVAFDDLLRQPTGKRAAAPTPWIWLPLALSLIVPFLVWAWISGGRGFDQQGLNPAGILIGTGLMFVVTLVLTDAWRGSRPALMLLPLLVSLDLALWGCGYVFAGGVRTVAEIAAQTDGPPAQPGARLNPAETHSPNPLLLRGFAIVRPYVGLPPRRVLPLDNPNELRVAGVDWTQRRDGWHRVPDPMPRARIVSQALVTTEVIREIGRVDVRSVAIVDRALPPLDPGASAITVAAAPGAISIDVKAAGAALLATTDAYHAGWRATGAGGRRLQTVRVYGDYLGVLLDPGTYRMTLAFDPSSFRAGAYVSIAGVILLMTLVATARRLGGAAATD
jgi:hypothetical protein